MTYIIIQFFFPLYSTQNIYFFSLLCLCVSTIFKQNQRNNRREKRWSKFLSNRFLFDSANFPLSLLLGLSQGLWEGGETATFSPGLENFGARNFIRRPWSKFLMKKNQIHMVNRRKKQIWSLYPLSIASDFSKKNRKHWENSGKHVLAEPVLPIS